MSRVCPAEAPSLDHVVGLADQLAERTLTAIENSELTTEEVWNSPKVALILEVAQLVRDSDTEFPPAMRRLAVIGQLLVHRIDRASPSDSESRTDQPRTGSAGAPEMAA